MRNHQLLLSLAFLGVGLSVSAQETRSSSSLYLNPVQKADVSIPFDIKSEGRRFTPTWGLDQAWINEQNLLKGINHMGKENVEIGRTAFRYSKPLTNDSALNGVDISALNQRNTIFNKLSPTLPLVFTADQEAVCPNEETGVTGPPEYFVKNKVANVDHWAAMINSHVHYMLAKTKHPIVGVSPFNEPDMWSTEEGATPERQRDVAKLLKEKYYIFNQNNIAIVGANTLNDDKAWNWFQTGQDYCEWGNTHQLAGSFANYAAFYENLKNAGKIGYNDEMHNVAEAMVGLEYGMTVGIWWGFDSRARGEFCQFSKHGDRIGYGEHRNNWMAGSVYRHEDGRVKAFVGSSERQAYTTTFQFVSTDRDVYYDGYGPVREYRMSLPGGTGYQKGQTNAERVIDVTWGEDVAPAPITEGIYKIVNRATNSVITCPSTGSTVAHDAFNASNKNQQWTIKPVTNRSGGDLSFFDIESVNNANIRLNVKNYATGNGEIIAWKQDDGPTSNEQWYFEYAGDGWYFIRNRESALYLASGGPGTKASVKQLAAKPVAGNATYNRYLWRVLPLDVNFETNAPAQPSGLIAAARPASVKLSWNANAEDDLEGYMVVRAEQGTDEWNTIARKLKTNWFIDNTCQQGKTYIYKVKAIDLAQNLSAASETAEATPTGEPSLIGRWQMDDNLYDSTSNMMDAAYCGTPTYMDEHQSGTKSINCKLNSYVQLPYSIADSEELTVSMWVYLRSSSQWQRLFDFGNDTEHYMFLTPSNGSVMTFGIKNGGDELTVKTDSKLATNKWKHVAVTIGKNETAIFVDGVKAGSSTGINIRPCDIRPSLNYIGRSQFAADPYLIAYIDDVRVYNYAQTAEEIQQDMSNTTSSVDQLMAEPIQESSIYTLDGKKIDTPAKGINIIDGRKVVRK